MAGVVVIGAGQAGASCVAKLRSLGYEGAITLIGEEPVPPYQRPPLSKKYLFGELEVERLYLRSESFYADNAIDLIVGSAHRGVVARTMLGGFAGYVAYHAPCPVLLVHPTAAAGEA